MTVDAKYKTTATASGNGREGKTALADGTMELQLTRPKELGGPGGDGANPEKLFALGYSACFGITAALDVYLPGLPEADAAKLTETTHGICPYSNAIKAIVDIKTTTRA